MPNAHFWDSVCYCRVIGDIFPFAYGPNLRVCVSYYSDVRSIVRYFRMDVVRDRKLSVAQLERENFYGGGRGKSPPS